MKTTLIIDDGIMSRLKQEAARQGKTMSQLVEAALRRFLEPQARAPALTPMPEFDGGGCRVDIADRDALYHLMDGR